MVTLAESREPCVGSSYLLKICSQSTTLHIRLDPKSKSLRRMKSPKCLSQKSSNLVNLSWHRLLFSPQRGIALSHSELATEKGNTVTVRDLYPISSMNKCTRSLGDAKTFSTWGANSCNWQAEIAEESKAKSVFASQC